MTPTIKAPIYCANLDSRALATSLVTWRALGMPQGVLALLPEPEKGRLPELQSVCATLGVDLVGAIFPAIIEEADFRDHGVLMLPFQRMPAHALIADLPDDATLAATRIANALEPRLGEDGATLFMIFDAMVPNIASILDALYLRLADRVVYAGVNAGSERFVPMPCLFDANDCVGGGVLCLLLPGAEGAVLEHGYVAPKEIITATSTQGNRILSIDWRPAFEVYREQVRALYDIDLTRENFYQYAIHFPFGILLANNDLIVRIPVALESDGSLFCVGEVPANAMLTLLRAPRVDSVGSVERIASRLATDFHVDGGDLMTFYCAGRRMHLGVEEAGVELARLGACAGGARLHGALSLGEIGSLSASGYPMFHNATLVCKPWK